MASSNENNWRWYLFFIPLVLAFLAIVAIIYYFHRRRRNLKSRRSTLRNVTLVLEEDEKVKAKQERLSRMGSTRSNLSRMTSTKSSYSRSAIGRDVEREHRRLRATMGSSSSGSRNADRGLELGQSEKGLIPQDEIQVIGREDDDIEGNGGDRDHIISRRKAMLSVIGESQGESSRLSNTFNSDADAAGQILQSRPSADDQMAISSSAPAKSTSIGHDRQGSTSTNSGGGDPFISPVTAISQNNPFASPEGSPDHEVPASSSAIPTPPANSQSKSGLGRKFSEVIRLRSPVPPRSSPSRDTTGSSDKISPAANKVSTDTFGVRASARPSGSGSQTVASANQFPVPSSNGRTSTSSSRSVTTQMIGAPSTSSPKMVASPIRSNSIDASAAQNASQVGGSEWTYQSKADQWRKPRQSLEASGISNAEGKDYLTKDPNPLGLSNLPSNRSPSLKAQSATHLPLPKPNRNDSKDGAELKRAVSIGAAGSKFKETFDDSP